MDKNQAIINTIEKPGIWKRLKQSTTWSIVIWLNIIMGVLIFGHLGEGKTMPDFASNVVDKTLWVNIAYVLGEKGIGMLKSKLGMK